MFTTLSALPHWHNNNTSQKSFFEWPYLKLAEESCISFILGTDHVFTRNRCLKYFNTLSGCALGALVLSGISKTFQIYFQILSSSFWGATMFSLETVAWKDENFPNWWGPFGCAPGARTFPMERDASDFSHLKSSRPPYVKVSTIATHWIL